MAKKHLIDSTSLVTSDAPPRRQETKAADFVSIYTNDIGLQTSAWDVRLVLGEVGEIKRGDPAIVNIKQLAEIRMSPQLAKRLAGILLEQLKAYEDQFGRIPVAQD